MKITSKDIINVRFKDIKFDLFSRGTVTIGVDGNVLGREIKLADQTFQKGDTYQFEIDFEVEQP